MDMEEEQRKRREFREILFVLAKTEFPIGDDTIRDDIYKEFQKIYGITGSQIKFRHFYSDIFSVLREIRQTPAMGTIDLLGENIFTLWKYCRSSDFDKTNYEPALEDALRKLYDHVSLDIARMQYSDAGDNRLSQIDEIKHLRDKISAMQKDLDEAKELRVDLENAKTAFKKTDKRLKKSKRTLKSLQKEYVAILGIFASIVLAFTGGISFSSAVLSNIAQSSIYRICAISLIIGLVFTNIIFGIFYYLNNLIKGKSKLNAQLLWISNGVLLLLLVGVILAWACGLAEARNRGIEAEQRAHSLSITSITQNDNLGYYNERPVEKPAFSVAYHAGVKALRLPTKAIQRNPGRLGRPGLFWRARRVDRPAGGSRRWNGR